MANLLHPKGKKIVRAEYLTRVAVVWMFLFASAATIVAILMVPTYVLISAQYDALSVRFDNMRAQQEAFDAYEMKITEANTLARYIEQNDTSWSLMSLIEEIETLAGSDVVITEYTFSQTPTAVSPMTVGGIAKDRMTLAAFRDALAAHEHFAGVELPISSLAADEDVPFAISLTLRTE